MECTECKICCVINHNFCMYVHYLCMLRVRTYMSILESMSEHGRSWECLPLPILSSDWTLADFGNVTNAVPRPYHFTCEGLDCETNHGYKMCINYHFRLVYGDFLFNDVYTVA